MGRLARSYRRAVAKLKFAVVSVFAVVVAVLQIANSQFSRYLWLIPSAILFLFVIKVISRALQWRGKFVNSDGYVVLSKTRELEHRQIAVALLNRDLERNEVVHHINGKKTDNRVSNLCLMDREKHEHFHAWLSWKKNKSGLYPNFQNQKRILEQEYGGTLLENVHPHPTKPPESPIQSEDIQQAREFESALNEKPDLEMQRKLFVELRNERTRLAEQSNIPPYLIFHDKTLHEMAACMPISKHAMLELSAVSREKYEAYGPYFIEVIRKFRSKNNLSSNGKRDPA